MSQLLNDILFDIPDKIPANAKIADLDLAFSDNAVNPNDDFEASFYNGTPLYDGLGNPNPRLSAMTDYNKSIDYGIQSNDPSIREILKGVAMIASVDVTTINDTSAYQAWMGKAMASMADGIQNVGIAQAKLGKQQEYLSENLSLQQDKADIYNNRIVALEQVDPYEAATRLTALETQLNATYAVTSRVLKLTYLNYM